MPTVTRSPRRSPTTRRRAAELLFYKTANTVTPTTLNSLGAKGFGEAHTTVQTMVQPPSIVYAEPPRPRSDW
jgi:hypothetical protein